MWSTRPYTGNENNMPKTKSTLTHLECGLCGKTYAADQLMNLCPACGKPLLARYDLAKAARTLTSEPRGPRAEPLALRGSAAGAV